MSDRAQARIAGILDSHTPAPLSAAARQRINEVLAGASSFAASGKVSQADWVELYNGTGQAVDLARRVDQVALRWLRFER
jgi:hypothetical protein